MPAPLNPHNALSRKTWSEAVSAFLVEAYCKLTSPTEGLRRVGKYETLDEAIEASKRTVDESLRRLFKPGVSQASLYAAFQARGETPYIFRTGDYTLSSTGFNPLQYAMSCCAEMCARKTA